MPGRRAGMKVPWSREAQVVRQQRKLRRERVASTPDMSVRVTIERRYGGTVTSTISGVGVDLTAALWNARGRAGSMFREVGDHLERLLDDELEPEP
jgi:hypothetical protein